MFDLERLKQAIDEGVYMGEGIARKTIAISDKIVAKIPKYKNCMQQAKEIEFYKNFEDSFPSLLPKMYGVIELYDNRPIIFMERAKPLRKPVKEYLHKFYLREGREDEYYEWCEEIDYFEHYTNIGDSSSNADNWGMREDGTFVCLDCGMSRDDYYSDDKYYDYYSCWD